MGLLKQKENDNGTVDLEIIYGGKEASFGGVDASAPPMYIDPRCFTDANGFMIYNDQLVAMGWRQIASNIGDWPAGAKIVGSGSFFANGRYNNFLLAYILGGINAGPPASRTVTYYLYVWPSGLSTPLAQTAQLAVTQYAETLPATSAVAYLSYGGGNAVSAGSVTLTVGAANVVQAINIGDSALAVATNLVALINGTAGYPCTATLNTATQQIQLTTVVTGAAANSTTLIVTMAGAMVPAVTISQLFAGATDQVSENFCIPIDPLSWVAVGESVYFGGPGSMILQYTNTSGSEVFSVLTQYLGAVQLYKFNSQLIAAGIIPGPGQDIQFPEMIVGWSAPNNYGTWTPTTPAGLVTGAGFNQISDIADYITGILISNSMAIILRAQGLDYATATGNSTIPFDFNHISNAKLGEGCQDGRLVTQYDQIGAFVGNSDVYEFSGSLVPVGAKIKNLVVTDSQTPPINRSATSAALSFDTDINAYAFFLIDYVIYVYSFANKTWMLFDTNLSPGVLESTLLAPWAAQSSVGSQTQFTNSYNLVLINVSAIGQAPTFWYLDNLVQDYTAGWAKPSYVEFMQEEIALGRDITVDSLYVLVAGSPLQELNWSVSGVLHGALILPLDASPDVFVGYQVFFVEGSSTVKNPQVRLDVSLQVPGINASLSIAKLALFGSYDPNQRPT